MPSRQPLVVAEETPPPPLTANLTANGLPNHHSHHHHPKHSPFIIPVLAAAAVLTFLIFLAVLCRKLTRKRTAPADLKSPHRFSYAALRRATSSFTPAHRLGQGGFGSVFRGTLPSGQEIAVKVMDSGSLQGEREFQNELSLAGKIDNEHIVSLIGFSSDHKRRRMLLVYELMHNRSLQDALLDRKCVELMEWKRRFAIAIGIAKGLDFLHNACNPPIIHGDIKPSNILLDRDFNAKIADFGLARSKIEENCEGGCGVSVIEVEGEEKRGDDCGSKEGKTERGLEVGNGGEDNGSILEENESVTTGCEEVNCGAEVSPESFARAEASPETGTVEASASEMQDKTSVSEGYFDKFSVDSSGKDLGGGGGGNNQRGGRKNSISGKDWWWRQDNGGGSESGSVKDYVMEWIGSEIKKERPKSDWISPRVGDETTRKPSGKTERKKQHRRLEWWTSLDDEQNCKKEKSRPAREWWREEFCEELARKKKKKKSSSGSSAGDNWWQGDDESVPDRKRKKKSRSRGSRSSVDWWLDGISGEFRIGRRSSQDWASGDIPKSGVSSTPSMRGTVCYIAPEYGGGGQLSEKCDMYSYGVLLLVLVSGRRPLQVTASPMSEFERANLISWARHLAHRGKLSDLFDPALQSLDQEQALLCVTVALLCLHRSPAKRPSIQEVVGMLSGESEPPHLPIEFSPSPPSTFPIKSRKKAR